MGQVILGRVISGAGASGMASLVSILITGRNGAQPEALSTISNNK